MYNIYEYFKFGGGGMTDLLQKLNFQIFGNFRAMDILDILMVAYIIYLFIHLVRETRAEPLLKGILMIIVVMRHAVRRYCAADCVSAGAAACA